MSERIKFYFQGFVFFCCMLITAFMAPIEAEAASVRQVPTKGKDLQGKYSVYQIDGELEVFDYYSKDGSTKYSSDDLIGRMRFISDSDLNKNGYVCGFVCKDTAGNIVGITPERKWMLKKK